MNVCYCSIRTESFLAPAFIQKREDETIQNRSFASNWTRNDSCSSQRYFFYKTLLLANISAPGFINQLVRNV